MKQQLTEKQRENTDLRQKENRRRQKTIDLRILNHQDAFALLHPNQARIVKVEQSGVRLKEENKAMKVQMNQLRDQQQRDQQQMAANEEESNKKSRSWRRWRSVCLSSHTLYVSEPSQTG